MKIRVSSRHFMRSRAKQFKEKLNALVLIALIIDVAIKEEEKICIMCIQVIKEQ